MKLSLNLPSWAKLCPVVAQVGPSWDQDEAKLMPSWGQAWPCCYQVGASWSHIEAKLVQVGASWGQVGAKLGPSWSKLVQVGASWGQVEAKLGQVGSKLGPSWTKMAPRWVHHTQEEGHIKNMQKQIKLFFFVLCFQRVRDLRRKPKWIQNDPR